MRVLAFSMAIFAVATTIAAKRRAQRLEAKIDDLRTKLPATREG